MTFKSMRFAKSNENTFDFQIVQTGKDEIVARLSVEITAEGQADFSYYMYDEGDQVRVGESRDKVETTFDAGVLITLRGPFPSNCELDGVELVDATDSVEFDDISPDYSDDGDYEDRRARI